MAMHAGGKVVWRGDDIFFRIETPDGTPGSVFETRAWSRKKKSMRVVSNERNARTLTMFRGPRGGSLTARGTGALLDFVENRSEERRGGKEGCSTCRSRRSAHNYKKKQIKKIK